jgi:hypothetical protein
MKKFVRIRTRNSTSRPLRRSILVDNWAICRLGSRTATDEVFDPKTKVIEVNTIEAVENSRSKLRMKSCFYEARTKSGGELIPQANWWDYFDKTDKGELIFNNSVEETESKLSELPYPLVAKRVFGFQGRGMSLIEDERGLLAWLRNHPTLDGWYFEKFYNYAREYRLHVGRGVGVFLSWRKLRTKDAKDRWFFNSTNSDWVGEQHRLFDRPRCWKAMEKAAVAALESTGLDIGAVDIRVQSNKNCDHPKFIVCEINSAPALGELGVQKYREVIKTIIDNKANGK